MRKVTIRNSGIDNPAEMEKSKSDLMQVAEDILFDTCTDRRKAKSFSMPIAELATLGAGVASLVPVLRTVTETNTMDIQGLYQLANASVGDTLKVAKNGNFYGAFKTAEGKSKFVTKKLQIRLPQLLL